MEIEHHQKTPHGRKRRTEDEAGCDQTRAPPAQVILGATLERAMGPNSLDAVISSVRRGTVVDITGRMQTRDGRAKTGQKQPAQGNGSAAYDVITAAVRVMPPASSAFGGPQFNPGGGFDNGKPPLGSMGEEGVDIGQLVSHPGAVALARERAEARATAVVRREVRSGAAPWVMPLGADDVVVVDDVAGLVAMWRHFAAEVTPASHQCNGSYVTPASQQRNGLMALCFQRSKRGGRLSRARRQS